MNEIKIKDYINGLINSCVIELNDLLIQIKNNNNKAELIQHYAKKYRLLMLKTYVLVNWCSNSEITCRLEQLLGKINNELECYYKCSRGLSNIKNTLSTASIPCFVVDLGYDILTSVNGFEYNNRIKKELDILKDDQIQLSNEDKHRILKIILLKNKISPKYNIKKVLDGNLILGVKGYFEIIFSINEYSTKTPPIITNIQLLFSQSTYLSTLFPQCNGYITSYNSKAIIQHLQIIVDNSDDYFEELYIKMKKFCNILIILILLTQSEKYGYNPSTNDGRTEIKLNIWETSNQNVNYKRTYNGNLKSDFLSVNINNDSSINCKLLSSNNNEYELDELDTTSISIEKLVENVFIFLL